MVAPLRRRRRTAAHRAAVLVAALPRIRCLGNLETGSAITAVGCSPIRKGCWPCGGVAREDVSGEHVAEVSLVATGMWTTRPTLSSELSRRLVDAAVAAATSGGLCVTVVTVDESGVLTEARRMDGAPLVSLQTA